MARARKLPRPTPAVLLAFLALFVALGGTGYALNASGVPDPAGLFHGCVNKRTGAIRLVNRGTKCRTRATKTTAAEKAVAWSQRGPVGATGSTGAVGPSDGYFSSSPAGGGGSQALVTVPAGDYVASGGCTASQTMTSSESSTVPVFGEAQAFLSTSQPFAGSPPTSPGTVESDAAVPDMGETVTGYGTDRFGSASLSNSSAFELPQGGTIYETCGPAVAGHDFGGSDEPLTFTNPYVTAIRVGTLHAQ